MKMNFIKNPLMIFRKNVKMADLIHQNYLLLPVINRFGIELGFGDKTIEEICNIQKVNIDFFLEIVNTFHDKNYFPEKHLQTFSITEIVEYLKITHEYFLSIKLCILEKYIDELFENTITENREKLLLVKNFYKNYKNELIEHIDRENNIVYPYVLEIEQIFKLNQINEIQRNKIKEYSIKKYENEHENVEEKLFDLKNLIIKYLPPSKNTNISNSILFELFELENDLNDHQRIEEKVLIPKVNAMEEFIIENL